MDIASTVASLVDNGPDRSLFAHIHAHMRYPDLIERVTYRRQIYVCTYAGRIHAEACVHVTKSSLVRTVDVIELAEKETRI